jgi:hypothetical protein
MTLRESLGRDTQRVHDQVDALLDREGGLMVLFDGDRMVSYTQGFGVSPDQLELLSVELERAVRTLVGGQPTTNRRERRKREKSKQDDDRGRDAVLDQYLGRNGRRDHSSVVDGRSESVRPGNATHGNSSGAVGRVLRLASETA